MARPKGDVYLSSQIVISIIGVSFITPECSLGWLPLPSCPFSFLGPYSDSSASSQDQYAASW